MWLRHEDRRRYICQLQKANVLYLPLSSSIILLVGIGHEALMVEREVAHDDVVALLEDALHFLRALAFGHDGSMDDEAEFVPRDEVEASLTGQDIEAAVDGDGHDGQSELVGQLEGTATKLCHVPREGAGSFGKDDERHAVAKDLSALFVGLVDGFRTALVHENVACALAGLADERESSQRLLHHPAETATEEAVDEKDVECSLMVGDEDVGLLLVQQFSSLNFNRQEHHPAHQPAPNHCRIITPGSRLAQCATDDGDNSCQGCCYDDDWQGDKELVKSVKKFHGISTPSLFLGILSLS